MNEAHAAAWIEARYGRAAVNRLERFVAMVIAENARQNLISPATVDTIWVRHVLDSAQLLRWDKPGRWVDIGTGGGFPGLVVGALRSDPVVLIEPRRKRADFLRHAAHELRLRNVTLEQHPVENIKIVAELISARAVASVEKLLSGASHCATRTTRWLLPRGQVGDEQLLALKSTWSGVFHVEQSLTSEASSVLILDGTPA